MVTYCRAPNDTEDDMLAAFARAGRSDPWDEIAHTSADIEAARSEVAEIEASLADVEEELGWAALTGDGPGCNVLAPMAEAAVRDLATARKRLTELEG